ncbi:MAG: hypothetical protein WCF18_15120 [Chthoniobacteraceae bacterium]
MNILTQADPSSVPAERPSLGFLEEKATALLNVEALTSGLLGEFPLHSVSELRRTISDAENDLWPRRDPIDILDRARERLREGLVG